MSDITARQLNRIESVLVSLYGAVVDMRMQMQEMADATATAIVDLEESMAIDFSTVEAALNQNADAVDSAAVLLDQLAEAIRNIPNDDPAVQAQLELFASELVDNSGRLASAVVRNTPAEPPEPEPTPT